MRRDLFARESADGRLEEPLFFTENGKRGGWGFRQRRRNGHTLAVYRRWPDLANLGYPPEDSNTV